MHIAVDLDDVVLDFFQGVIDSMTSEFGPLPFTKADCTTWDKNPVKQFPWKEYGYKSWWDWMQRRDWIWTTFKTIPGAIGGVNRLRAQGHYLELLTSKPEWAEWAVWKWLGRWRPPFQRVTIVGPKDAKHDVSEAVVLIDDKPDNILGWVTNPVVDGDFAFDRWGVLFDQPWNALEPERLRVSRAFGWAHTVQVVERLTGAGHHG